MLSSGHRSQVNTNVQNSGQKFFGDPQVPMPGTSRVRASSFQANVNITQEHEMHAPSHDVQQDEYSESSESTQSGDYTWEQCD